MEGIVYTEFKFSYAHTQDDMEHDETMTAGSPSADKVHHSTPGFQLLNNNETWMKIIFNIFDQIPALAAPTPSHGDWMS